DLFVARLTGHWLQTHVSPPHPPTGTKSVPRPAIPRQCCSRRPHAATAAPSLGAVKTTGPAAVQASVCSKCAERALSAVTTVHWSPRVLVSGRPTFTIGSIARQRPSLMGGLPWPRAGREGDGGVGVPPVDDRPGIDADDVSVLETPLARDPMNDLVVHGGADRRRVAVIAEERRRRACLPKDLGGDAVELRGGDPRAD